MASKQTEALKSALAAQAGFATAAHAFTEPTKQTIEGGGSEESLGEDLSSSWNAVIEVAANTEHEAQEPLVETMKAIQKQQIGSGDKTNQISVWGDQVKLWEDMPLFGATMRDAWNRGMYWLELIVCAANYLQLRAQATRTTSQQSNGLT